MSWNLGSIVTLNNNVEMPRFGLGVYQSAEGAETENAVRYALESGYGSTITYPYVYIVTVHKNI